MPLRGVEGRWRSCAVAAAMVLSAVTAAHGGACCLSDGSCTDVPIAGICAAIGGEYLGDGTDCATSACDGACCLPDGSCSQQLPADCATAGGLFQGRGSICADFFCGVSGCCLPDETCATITFVDCVGQGGLPLGAGATCNDVICAADSFDFPLSPNSEILALDRFNTLGGLLRLEAVTVGLVGNIGAQATIENLSGIEASTIAIRFVGSLQINDIPGMLLDAAIDESLPVPPLAPSDGVPGSGADFLDLGFISAGGRDSAMLVSPPDDLSFFEGLGPFPATVEASGVLMASGASALAFLVSDFHAFGDVVVAYRYTVLGACCLDDGSCTLQTQAECLANPDASSWTEGVACADVACGPGEGACCFLDSSCAVLEETACMAAGGAFQGPASMCLGLICRGACCLGNGQCLFLSELKCIEFGGTYFGDGTVCDPSPCPTLLGACCFPNDTCQILTPAQCHSSGGAHQGAGTACDVASCGVACVADVSGPFGELPDGNVDALDLLTMLGEWGGSCAQGCAGDVAGPADHPDGQVDSLDFLMLLSEWGSPALCGP